MWTRNSDGGLRRVLITGLGAVRRVHRFRDVGPAGLRDEFTWTTSRAGERQKYRHVLGHGAAGQTLGCCRRRNAGAPSETGAPYLLPLKLAPTPRSSSILSGAGTSFHEDIDFLRHEVGFVLVTSRGAAVEQLTASLPTSYAPGQIGGW